MRAEAKSCGAIAAFFDLDGTLIPDPSLEQRFFHELRGNGAIPFANYLRWGVETLRLLSRGLLAVQHENKRYLAGVCRDLVFRHMESISFFEEGIARLMWHVRQNHEIVLMSGTLEPLARLAARAIECELEARGVERCLRFCATRLREEHGHWTGHLDGEGMYGLAKAQAITALAKAGSLDLRQSHAYGNSLLDRDLLCAVGHAHAVNPGKKLAALANEKDWPIWHWHLRKESRCEGGKRCGFRNPGDRGAGMKNRKMREWRGSLPASDCVAAGQFAGRVVVLPATGREAPRVFEALKRQLALAWAACGAFEWMALAYLGASSGLIAMFAHNLAHPWRLLATQAIVATLVLTLCRVQAGAAAREALHGVSCSSLWWHFWRHWYPHLFFLFCFEELAHLMTLYTPHWQDAKLIAFDYWLTGVHPTIWLEQFATTSRNEFMQLVYLSYFTYLLILGGILYLRREWHAYWSIMTYSMVGYMVGYLIAMFFPVESPWFALAGSWRAPLAGGPVTATVNFIEHLGRVRGAAFPSEHVAGATAALWGAWKFRRYLFWMLLPVFLFMCVSTIWGRYHYVADVFAGMTTGTIGFVIGSWIMQQRGAVKTAPEIRTK